MKKEMTKQASIPTCRQTVIHPYQVLVMHKKTTTIRKYSLAAKGTEEWWKGRMEKNVTSRIRFLLFQFQLYH